MVFESATRPWGAWHVLDEGEGYKVKRIEVLPGRRLSYQTHELRSEHWYVVAGTATCILDGDTFVVPAGASMQVPAGAAHRIANLTEEGLVLIEVQRGGYLEEDDIVRLQDDYGRSYAED